MSRYKKKFLFAILGGGILLALLGLAFSMYFEIHNDIAQRLIGGGTTLIGCWIGGKIFVYSNG